MLWVTDYIMFTVKQISSFIITFNASLRNHINIQNVFGYYHNPRFLEIWKWVVRLLFKTHMENQYNHAMLRWEGDCI